MCGKTNINFLKEKKISEYFIFDVIDLSLFFLFIFSFVIQLYLYFLSHLSHSSLLCRIFSFEIIQLSVFFFSFYFACAFECPKVLFQKYQFTVKLGSIVVTVLQGKN